MNRRKQGLFPAMQPPILWQNLLPELRGKDFDRYACCLFAAPEQRTDLTALFLFNAELAQIRDQVTEPLLGHIRLQWWCDALAALGNTGNAPNQPTLDVIARWHQRDLDLAPLQTLLDGRAADLANPPFPTLTRYAAYRRDTSRPLGLMAVSLLEQEQNAALYADSMEHYATIGLLRAMPHWVRRRQMPLPPEWLQQYDINETDLMELRPSPGLTACLHAQAAQALTAGNALRQRWRALPKPERQAGLAIWLHVGLAQHDAKVLLQTAAPWQRTMPTRWLRLGRLAWHSLRGI